MQAGPCLVQKTIGVFVEKAAGLIVQIVIVPRLPMGGEINIPFDAQTLVVGKFWRASGHGAFVSIRFPLTNPRNHFNQQTAGRVK